MEYREIQPQGMLGHFVQSFWQYRHLEAQSILHTILPDGCFDLIVEFKNGVLHLVKLTGVWTSPVEVSLSPGTEILAVRFKLLAAEYLFGHELTSILDTVQELSLDFWNIKERGINDLDQLIDLVEQRFSVAVPDLRQIDSRKLKLFALIYTDECLSVSRIADQVGWSSRQINRYFNRQFGCSLKTIIDIIRCHTAYDDIAHGSLKPQHDLPSI